ncbi:hypothetical protein DV737_g5585, partial [Chaetothyriales sp. CBS 132003]
MSDYSKKTVADLQEILKTAPSPDTALAATTNYALNLPAESLDDEAARRKKRAERFGINTTASNGQVDLEEAKKAARAEKFGTGGTGGTGLGKLNEALPTERIRGAKASKASGEDTKAVAYTSEKDRAAAEARKQRFAQAS